MHAGTPGRLDDTALLLEGRRALRERLGILRSLRFLRLVTGQADQFEEIRAAWEDMSEEELFSERRLHRPRSAG